MKRLLFLLLFPILHASAQNLTGIWRGTFYNSPVEIMYGSNNKYEIQIDNADRALKGVTYSYQNTSFYGKASLIGMWTPGTKNLIFKEDKLLEYKMRGGNNDDDGVYMFTCYLEYRKDGDKEILEGSYTSQHYKTGKDGTKGKIYLEKVVNSSFKKEDFIIKKEKLDSAKAAKPPVKPQAPITQKTTPPKQPLAKTNTPAKTIPAKPKQETVKSTLPKKITPPPTPTVPKKEVKPDVVKADPPKKIDVKPIELPTVLKERQNDLIRTITTSANELEVSLYDNGEIDGDTISVYLNGRQIASHRGLSTRPITLKIKIDEANPEQELTMVAENLGSIPPNTALMIVNAGEQRYDLRISSSDKNNAVVHFRYQAAGGANK